MLIFPAHKLNILKLSIFHCLNPYLSVVGAQISSAGYDYSYDAIPLVLDAADCRLMLPLASYLGFCILLVLSLSVARPWLDHGDPCGSESWILPNSDGDFTGFDR